MGSAIAMRKTAKLIVLGSACAGTFTLFALEAFGVTNRYAAIAGLFINLAVGYLLAERAIPDDRKSN